MRKLTAPAVILLLVFLKFAGSTQAACDPSQLNIITLASDGSQINGALTQNGARPTAGGRYIAFSSGASNLVANDTNGFGDVFLYDTQLCTSELVSLAPDGSPANGSTRLWAVSADGRYFIIDTDASNIISNPQSQFEHILYDRQTHQATRFSTKRPIERTVEASFSHNGHYVIYRNLSVNEVDKTDLYLYDLQTGQTQPVPILPPSLFPRSTASPIISDDARYVAFISNDPQLTGVEFSGGMVFLRDRQAGTTTLISVSSVPGVVIEAGAGNISMTADGRLIAFSTWAANVLPIDNDNDTDIFVRDWQAGTTSLVSVPDDVPQADDPAVSGTWGGQISADGRYVIFAAYRKDLLSSANDQSVGLFLRDLKMQQTAELSVGIDRVLPNGDSYYVNLSDNNATITFASWANNLVAGDIDNANQEEDLFTIPLAQPYRSFTVNSSSDTNDGACDPIQCSLREAMLAANDSGSLTSVIGFQIPGSGVHTIQPTTPLPALAGSTFIAGQSQPGFTGTPLIEIDGSVAGAGANGITLNGGYGGVRSLIINRFNGIGIQINTLGGNEIVGNYIGTNQAGSGSFSPMSAGISINNAPNNYIGRGAIASRNIISGNLEGIVISGIGASRNLVQGNFIGTNVAGTAALGNSLNGIRIDNAPQNRIRYRMRIAPNVISGNGNGILISGSDADANEVMGNYIGTNAAGTAALGNTLDGVRVEGASDTSIGVGGDVIFVNGNVISGNANGVHIIGPSATGTRINGNLIGTNAAGTIALGNLHFGVWLENVDAITIGGTTTSQTNVISGNNPSQLSPGGGIRVSGTGNIIQGNKIGTDKSGASAIGNGTAGIWLDGAINTQIDGISSEDAYNVIAYNNGTGILISGASAVGNLIRRNRIYANTGLGIDISSTVAPDGVTPNDIGDADTGPNKIQNFPDLALAFTYSTPFPRLVIRGQMQGVPSQTIRLEFYRNDSCNSSGNGEGQQYLSSSTVSTGASGTFTFKQEISTTIAAGKFISAVAIDPTGNTSEFSVCTKVLAPQPGPIFTVNTTGDGNVWCTVASCSLREAILAANDLSGSDTINFNIIGTPLTIRPTSPLPLISGPVTINATTQPGYNGKPIVELSGSQAGPNADGLSFVTSGNVRGLIINSFSAHGIRMQSGGQVTGNYIGTDRTGTLALSNGSGGADEGGIYGTSFVTIGGTALNTGNLISGNNPNGIFVTSSSDIKGNIIGLNAAETAVLPNSIGIRAGNSALIGGESANGGNVISGNTLAGILLQGHQDTVYGNYVGVNRLRSFIFGNGGPGIDVAGSFNVIGGWETGQQNVIAFNLGAGIQVRDDERQASQNQLASNLIYSNGGLGIDLFPAGITPNDLNDDDTGVNNLQNFPVLNSVDATANQIHITGEFNSAANQLYRLDFFAGTSCDISTFGEGENWLGYIDILTNEQGLANFEPDLAYTSAQGQNITAIATDLSTMDTSEFSRCVVIVIPSPQDAAPQIHRYSSPSIRLSWNSVSWATGYEIQVTKSNSFGAATMVSDVTVDVSNLEYVWNATAEGQYFWRVGAKDANGAIWWSQIESFVLKVSS